MKNLAIILIAIAALFFLASCNNDDDSTNPNGGVNAVAGTYVLTSYTAPTQEDLNEDGTLSANLVSESACYTGWNIKLNADRTYTRTEKMVSVLDGEIICNTQVDTGNWDIQANNVKLVQVDGTELNSNYIYLDSNKSLTQSRQSQYPTIFEEIFIMTDATVNLLFTKQQ